MKMTTIPITVVLYACIFLLETETTTTPTSPPTPPPFHQGPQYTINCLEIGDVEVKGVSNTTSLEVVAGGTCTNSKSTFTANSTKIVIPRSCLSSTTFTDTRTVTFTIHDSTFDGKSRAALSSVPDLKGGQNLHTITVNCKPLPDSGMKAYVVHGVGLATPEPDIPTEIKKVQMRLKSEKYDSYKDVTDLPDVSTVYIGDKFYMYLVYLGKDQYSVIPTDCKAFEGAYASEPSSSVKKLDLYNTSCLSQDAMDYRVMHPFKNLKDDDNRVVSAEMYGFMFESNTDITFVCTVNICKKSTCTLTTCAGNKDWSPSSRRRRRDTRLEKQFTITKQLRVKRKTAANSAGFIESSCFCILLLQLFTRMW